VHQRRNATSGDAKPARPELAADDASGERFPAAMRRGEPRSGEVFRGCEGGGRSGHAGGSIRCSGSLKGWVVGGRCGLAPAEYNDGNTRRRNFRSGDSRVVGGGAAHCNRQASSGVLLAGRLRAATVGGMKM